MDDADCRVDRRGVAEEIFPEDKEWSAYQAWPFPAVEAGGRPSDLLCDRFSPLPTMSLSMYLVLRPLTLPPDLSSADFSLLV